MNFIRSKEVPEQLVEKSPEVLALARKLKWSLRVSKIVFGLKYVALAWFIGYVIPHKALNNQHWTPVIKLGEGLNAVNGYAKGGVAKLSKMAFAPAGAGTTGVGADGKP